MCQKKVPICRFLQFNQTNLNVKRLTTAGGRQLVAPIGAVPLAVTKPPFWNTGIRARAAEQSWSTSHRAWKKGRRWEKINQKRKKEPLRQERCKKSTQSHARLLQRSLHHHHRHPPPAVSDMNKVPFTTWARNQAGEPRVGYCSLRSNCLLELCVVLYPAAPPRERPINGEAGHGGIWR